MASDEARRRIHLRRVHRRPVRHWPAVIALLAVGIAYGLLPDRLREGPRWLLPALLTVFVTSAVVAFWLGRVLSIVVTAALMGSVLLLVTTLPGARVSGDMLFVYAALLWVINVVVFALWFWEVDGGGPHVRHPETYGCVDFTFPQFQQDPDDAASYWLPGFFDYLFLAFSTATSFGPTDTLVMSQRAKLVTMAETGLSLTIITVLVARAVGLL
jgi:hypothetical protein